MINIAIAGIGGVGGYIGGMLARYYRDSESVNIHFICRGESEKKIKEKGLTLDVKEGIFDVQPASVCSDASAAGAIDYLLLCTKSYDLTRLLEDLAPFIQAQTIILPLYNGVDSFEKIKLRFPHNEVWKGCVYMVARRVEPGYVKETGHNAQLFFGLENGNTARLHEFENIAVAAGIHAKFSENIEKTVWEKFVFISVMATLTSYYNKNFGGILNDSSCSKNIDALLNEILNVAAAAKIPLSHDIREQTLKKIKALPENITSSMHSDFISGKNTELNSLTGYVVEQGKLHNIPTPLYSKFYDELKLTFGNYRLQLLDKNDTLPFYKLVQNNFERLQQFFPLTVEGCKTLDTTKTMVTERIALAAKKEFISFMLYKRDDNTLLGSVFMKDIDWKIPKTEIGYFIDRDYEGKGIISKALELVTNYCFDELHMQKVFIRVIDENKASRKVAEKNGFELEGILRRDFKSYDGTLYDTLYFGLLNNKL